MEENWGEQEYEETGEQMITPPPIPPLPLVEPGEQLPSQKREPEISPAPISPAPQTITEKEQQQENTSLNRELIPTRKEEQQRCEEDVAPNQHSLAPPDDQVSKHLLSQQARNVDNNVNSTPPQPSEVIVEHSGSGYVTTNMELRKDRTLGEGEMTEVIFENSVEDRDQEECENAMRTLEKDNDDCEGMNKEESEGDKVKNDDDSNIETVMPSVSGKCEKMKNGLCRIHECEMKKFAVSTKKWGDRGGGKGFGWIHRKVTKFACLYEKLLKNPPITKQCENLDNKPNDQIMIAGDNSSQ